MTAFKVRGGQTTDDPRLGRVAPADWKHVDLYPLRTLAASDRPVGVPVGIGVNWYEAFYPDQLIRRGTNWWVRDSPDLGRLRGGHAITLEPFTAPHRDTLGWHRFYDQQAEGICVGETVARVGSLFNRRRYQPRPVYDAAQLVDEWAGETYSGTSVDAGFAVMRDRGLVRARRGEPHHTTPQTTPFTAGDGIAATRWATSDTDTFDVLGDPDSEYAVWLNSWGETYPHRVRVPRAVIERLRQEDGEFAIPSDR